nr:peptidase M28 [Sphingomonas sp.]
MTIGRFLLAPLAAALLGGAAPTASSGETAAQRVRADVEFLASDLLEGRDTGSRGYDIAAAFVASQFRSIGLKPGGTGGSWYLQVPFRRAVLDGEPKAMLTIGGRALRLANGTDFSVAPSVTRQVRSVSAPLVFAGHGISDARVGIDNYAGLDVRGKIVVVVQGTPSGLPSEISAHLKSVKGLTASGKGAAGLVQISGTADGPSRLTRMDRPVVDWVDPAGRTSSQASRLGLNAAISRPVAERLFAAARQDLSKVLQGNALTVRGFDLPARLSLSDR